MDAVRERESFEPSIIIRVLNTFPGRMSGVPANGAVEGRRQDNNGQSLNGMNEGKWVITN